MATEDESSRHEIRPSKPWDVHHPVPTIREYSNDRDKHEAGTDDQESPRVRSDEGDERNVTGPSHPPSRDDSRLYWRGAEQSQG